jgi:hypothetical protein
MWWWLINTEKFKEIQQNFECYEFALQSIIKKFIKLNDLDLTKVYIEYIPTKGKYGWIKGKFRITYPVDEKK